LKINSIATTKDLFETIDNFSEKSDWKLRYKSWFNYNLVYYYNLIKTFRKKNTFTNRIDAIDEKSSHHKKYRFFLHQTVNKWETELDKKSFISGSSPNIADLAMYGCFSAYEGCSLFRDIIATHETFRKWYDRMKFSVEVAGYQPDSHLSKLNFKLKSIDTDKIEIIETETTNIERNNSENHQNKSMFKQKFDIDTTVKLIKDIKTTTINANNNTTSNNNNNNNRDDLKIFRILTVTYLVHVAAFTFAAWMSK
jgi:hypothetical protein